MAFRDLSVVLYGGKVKLDYKDKAHRYYVRHRVDWGKDPEDPKAWGKITYPRGTTTILGDTLEKKGLMQWPKGLALTELFGYYNFTNEEGRKLVGFSKDKGTIWGGKLDPEVVLPLVVSADTAWARKQKQGADIGSIVHDAIERYILANTNNPELKGQPFEFDISEQYLWGIKEAITDVNSPEYELAMERFPEEAEMAKKAFTRFTEWWDETTPILQGAEELLYSLEHNVSGTYDAFIGIKKEHHPMGDTFDKDIILCTTDWKTSNASTSKSAGAPEGIYYSYFIQLAIYEMMRREMGETPADDLMTLSARKDGNLSLVYLSELGLTVDQAIDWAKAVLVCHNFMVDTKKQLLIHGENNGYKTN